MKSLWNNEHAHKSGNDLLKLRIYSSRLLGQEEDLVLHGGGNTSVKIRERNIFGEEEDIIYIKGSGWDLATIDDAGFAPVKLKPLIQMAELDFLSDLDMVKYQRLSMTNPASPNPSVEAILHAIIPFTFVDHTHADAVVTISNTPDGIEKIQNLYSKNMLIVPYIMPGFILAKKFFKLTKEINWNLIEGIILLNHGVFTFHNDAKASYEKMINIVSKAEDYLKKNAPHKLKKPFKCIIEPLKIAHIRKIVSGFFGKPILVQNDNSEETTAYCNLPNLKQIMNRGPLTPDHIIRTKRIPVVLSDYEFEQDIINFVKEYKNYFKKFNPGKLNALDPAPRWAVWPGHGTLLFGNNLKDINIIRDITRHTLKAIYLAEQLNEWKTLSKKDLFEMEYWTLEQEKLKKDKPSKPLSGKIALVTGAANGIGKACVEKLVEEGAVVVAIDINPSIKNCFQQRSILGIECDVTDKEQLKKSVEKCITQFGGLDMLISNAGIFSKSSFIGDIDEKIWNHSLKINLTSHQQLIKICLPYLTLGIEPAIVIIGSKNVPAPGPGAAAYSVAKAALTQLGRIAALELGEKGIRVNIIHPNAVYDTGIWTKDILKTRAKHYGLSVEDYKTNNILKQQVSSKDVAEMAVAMLGPVFSQTTGAQVPVDGGNERVI